MSEENNDWLIRTKLLPAGSGDCIIFQYKDKERIIRNILIDGGDGSNYSIYLYNEMKETIFDLVVITHIDDDHIKGIVSSIQEKRVNQEKIKQYWFNASSQYSFELSLTQSSNLSVKQGVTLEKYLEESNKWHDRPISTNYSPHSLPDIEIKILSPDLQKLRRLDKFWKHEVKKNNLLAAKESDYHYSIEDLCKKTQKYDRSTTNGSSIAFLINLYNKNFLLLGDAHITLIQKSLYDAGWNKNNKLKLEYLKLSHHGSKYNIDDKFLGIVDCKKYIICSNGAHQLPDKEALSRIAIQKDVMFIFNDKAVKYQNIFTQREIDTYGIKFAYVSKEFISEELIWEV